MHRLFARRPLIAALSALVIGCTQHAKPGEDAGGPTTDAGVNGANPDAATEPSPSPSPSGPAQPGGVNGGVFHESFTWRGDHASVANADSSSSVFWNPDDWDVRSATDFAATDIEPGGFQTGHHIDIVKAASDDPTSGAIDKSGTTIGGDGSAGIGLMHISEQAIVSARLRNPMVISDTKPGIVRFNAPRFVTSGHWWEISLSPSDIVVGGELSPVPGDAANCHPPEDSCNDGVLGPENTVSSDNPGPGRRPAQPSIDVDILGWPDEPTDLQFNGPEYGYHFRFASKAQLDLTPVNNVYPATVDAFNLYNPGTLLPATTPDEIDVLYAFRLEFRPDGIDVYADFDRNGSFSYHEHLARTIPWKEVYVHFMAIAYQADHHPKQGYGWMGTDRDFKWRNLSVEPVKYARTSIAPRDRGTDKVARRTGWMSYDLRDIKRVGPDTNGVPQANPAPYDRVQSLAYTSFKPFFSSPEPVKSVDLDVELDADQAAALAARFVYDIRYRGTATLTINGTSVGKLVPATSAPGAAETSHDIATADFADMWVHRSVELLPSLLHAGTNHVHLDLVDNVQLDRLVLEFSH